MANSLYQRDAAEIAGIEKLRFFPLAVAGGRGSYLIDDSGRELLDLSATWGEASPGQQSSRGGRGGDPRAHQHGGREHPVERKRAGRGSCGRVAGDDAGRGRAARLARHSTSLMSCTARSAPPSFTAGPMAVKSSR